MVGFAVHVDKTKDTKGGFDKKLLEGLLFMQTYINQNASFYPIKLGTMLKPIKEKGEFLKFQVTSQTTSACQTPGHLTTSMQTEAT
jgi:hypothetical protein